MWLCSWQYRKTVEELCWLLSKVALPLSKFFTLGAQVTEFQSSLHSSLSLVQYSHSLGHYKTGELGWADWKSMTDKCSLLYGFKWKIWRLLCQKMKKSQTWHFWVCRSTHTRRVAGCYQCSKFAWIYSRSFLCNRFFFLMLNGEV